MAVRGDPGALGGGRALLPLAGWTLTGKNNKLIIS